MGCRSDIARHHVMQNSKARSSCGSQPYLNLLGKGAVDLGAVGVEMPCPGLRDLQCPHTLPSLLHWNNIL